MGLVGRLGRLACIGIGQEAGQAMRRSAVALALTLSLAMPARAADNVVQWDSAEQHIGEEAVVEGRVLGVHCSPLSCLLAFDPTFNRFTAVVQAKDFKEFPPDQLARYSGRRVRVRGTIVARDRKPEIVVSNPDDLKLVETKEDKEKKAADRAEAQDQVLARLDVLLDRVEALTERMVAMQERMEIVVAQLDERTQALMMMIAATPPPAPAPPPYVGPEPQRGWEAMRSIKRGMAVGEVRRLMGDPLTVIPGGNGWTTWLYDGGRSVSFDGRGRAESVVGFPGS
jgi:hypothetical protein